MAQSCSQLLIGNKKVTRKRKKFEYPDHPDRFDRCAQVLCREVLTGIHCYWEVECTGDNMDIGLAYKGLDRKGWGWECRLGNNDKSWSLRCSHSQYSVYHKNMKTDISAPYSPRIAVYLNRPAGSLSFYSISHTMTLLHTFSTSFTEPLYAAFALESLPLTGTLHHSLDVPTSTAPLWGQNEF
uniref:B30.2/SPRY domain-containing protein n=1 Tax=Erpetoichthys calabaricus TaxID=27687 RepID=A0A8C4T668_ERPCA